MNTFLIPNEHPNEFFVKINLPPALKTERFILQNMVIKLVSILDVCKY